MIVKTTRPTGSPFTLDPFALPQETRGRFRMFIAAAVVLAWSLGAWWIEVPNIYALDLDMEPDLQQEIQRFSQDIRHYQPDPRIAKMLRDSQSVRRYLEHLRLQVCRILVSMFIATGAGLLGWLLYMFHPLFLARKYRTSALEGPVVATEVSRLAAIAGVEPPRVVIKAGFLDGVAFGRKGQEIVALGGHRALLAHPWSLHGKAVALHEMAHIANGDIRTRVTSSSIWIALTTALTGVGLLAMATSLHQSGEIRIPVFRTLLSAPLGASQPNGSAPILLRALVLLMAVWWLWSELIRTREFYADARVATWGFREPLLGVLRLQSGTRKQRGFARLHPTFAARIEQLESPIKLFQTSRRLAFLTGLLLTFIVAQLIPFSTDLTFLLVATCAPLLFVLGPIAILLLPISFFAVLCLLAYLVTGALGSQVQREAIAELATTPHSHWGYLRLVRTALYFALGLEGGLLLSPLRPFGLSKTALWVSAWLLILTFLTWIWLVFLKGTSRFILGSSPLLPHRSRRWITLLSTVILASLLGSALLFRLTIEVAHHFDQISQLDAAQANPVEFFSAIFVMTSFYSLSGALALYLAIACLTGLAVSLQFFTRHKRCLACEEPAPRLLLVGRRCKACGAALAPWPFLGELP